MVIGAGQAGLAAGYHLSKLGRPFLILDANDRIGDQWRRPLGLAPALQPGPLGRPAGHAVPRTRLELSDRPPDGGLRRDLCRLVRAAGPNGDARRSPDAGRRRQRRLHRRRRRPPIPGAPGDRGDRRLPHPKVPAFAGQLDPSIRQLHSERVPQPVAARGRPGPRRRLSATPAPTSPSKRPRPIGRSSPGLARRATVPRARHVARPARPADPRVLRGPRHHDPDPDGSEGASRSASRGRSARPGPRAGARPGRRRTPRREAVERRDGKPALDDGTVLDVANVIWATGFRPDYSWIELPVTAPTAGRSSTAACRRCKASTSLASRSSRAHVDPHPRRSQGREVRRRADRGARRGSACRRVGPEAADGLTQPGRSRSAGPMYRTSGRMSRLSAACSRTWAVQPAWRASENVAGNRSGVRPTPWRTGAA